MFPSKLIINKGASIQNCTEARVLDRPNVGTEGHSYLEYMLQHAVRSVDDRYDGYVFTQIKPAHHRTRTTQLRSWLLAAVPLQRFDCFGKKEVWIFAHGKGGIRVPSIPTTDRSRFCPGATFYVPRACVLKKRRTIQNISAELARKRTDGYALERSWNTLFDRCTASPSPQLVGVRRSQ